MTGRRKTGRGAFRTRSRGWLLLLATFVILVGSTAPAGSLPQADPLVPQPMAPAGPQARLLLRTGGPLPVEGRFDYAYDKAVLPGGGLVFVNGGGEALVLRRAQGEGRIILHVGDRNPDCGVVTEILQVATGADGSIAARIFCDGTLAIVRVAEAGGVLETPFRAGMIIDGSPVVNGGFWGPAVDGQGRIVVGLDDGPDGSALLRQAAGQAPEVLIKSGDPIGGRTFRRAEYEPAVNSGGTVAFRAILSGGLEVVASLTPGQAPVVHDSAPVAVIPPGVERTHLSPPAINDSGVVAFLHADSLDAQGYMTNFRVMRATAGTLQTIVAAGDPAPGGDTFKEIEWVNPGIDSTGAVTFGAALASGLSTLYRYDNVSTRLFDSVTGTGEEIYWSGGTVDLLVTADGTVYFGGYSYLEGGSLLSARNGTASVVMRSGEPLLDPARLVTLANVPFPLRHLSTGPSMAPDGGVLFDATVTGRRPGLFARTAGGTLSAVALDEDPAPGGGTFFGWTFSCHSIAAGGRVAFLAMRQDIPEGGVLELFTGPAGGPLVAAARPGDAIAGLTATIDEIGPPSRINALGQIAVPVKLTDGGTALLLWNGTTLLRFAASGDSLPDGETIAMIRTGEDEGLVAPLLEDSGSLYFGVVTAGGARALYRADLSLGLASATRVLGDGDVVEGGVLQPFLLRALTSDAAGRIAFQAVPAPGPKAATYVIGTGSQPSRVAGPEDFIGTGGQVVEALPRLAAISDGIVHETTTRNAGSGRVLWFATPRASTGSGPMFDHAPLNLGGMPSPDGGIFPGSVGFGVGPGFGGPSLFHPVRLGSDGDRFAVSVETTTIGPQNLVLWDFRPEGEAPVAMAGPNQTIECTGPSGAMVALDGSGSYDPANGALEYTWSSAFGTTSGPTASMTLPVGLHTIYLSVRNASGLVAADSLSVWVRDSVPPTISAYAVPDRLSPAGGQMVPVTVTVTTQDLCTARPWVYLSSITSNDPRIRLSQDVSGAALGTDDRTFSLRARRGGIGRAWTVTYTAIDSGGNRTPYNITIPVGKARGR